MHPVRRPTELQIQYSECDLTIDGVRHTLARPIIAAATDGERVFVIFDYMAYPRDSSALNLVALDRNGELLWTVSDNPIDSPTAAYTNFSSIDPLTVGNFAGFSCVVDAATGTLLESQFTK